MPAPSFALIVPVFNEEKTLNEILDRVLTLPRVSQCVIIDDGSTDGTAAILRKRLEAGGEKLRIITHPMNRGKGAAVRSGLTFAQTDFAIIQDADAEYDPSDLAPLFSCLEQGQAEVVFGSRFLTSNPNLYPTYLWGNKFLTWFINCVGRGHLTDAYTCYKGMALSRWRALELTSEGFELEAEIATKCLLAGWRIKEVPIRYSPRSFSEGKKIRPTDAWRGMLKCLTCRLFGGKKPLDKSTF